jgi:hypothetical protein
MSKQNEATVLLGEALEESKLIPKAVLGSWQTNGTTFG